MTIELISSSPEQTRDLGLALGRRVPAGAIMLLQGELGAGKTHLAKGICSALGIPANAVTSPTFTLRNRYEGRHSVEHLDLYRLEEPEEVEDAGLLEWDAGTVVLVEWAQKFPELFPGFWMALSMERLGPEDRRIRLVPGRVAPELMAWLTRLDEART